MVPTVAAPTDITDAGPTPPVLLDGLGALSGRTVRAIYWVFASLVAVVPAAVTLLRLPDVASFFVLQVHYCVVAALAVAFLGIQAGRSAGMERIVWAHLSAMAGLLLASQLQHTVRALVTGVLAPDIVVASALGVSALLVFVSMYARVARLRHATVFSRLRLGVDTVLIAFIGSTMGYQFVWRPWFDTVGIHDTTVRVVASIQPVIGLALIVGTLINIVGPRPSRWRSWESMLVLAFALFGANLSLWPGSYLSEYRGTEVVVAEVLVGSLGVLGMAGLLGAALYRLTERGGRWNVGPLPGVKPSSGWLSTLGLPAFELLAIPVFGVLATSSEGPMQRMYSMSVMVVVASLILRTALTTADNGDLSRRSVTDALTGLENHRGFQERLAAAVSGAERFGETCCLTVLDLDDFAAVNETSGHASGDLMLVEVANVMRERVRESDVVCRIGGDEMAILFPVTPLAEAVAVSERVLEGLRIVTGPHGRALTASAGVAAFPLHASDREQLFRRADGAQYWAKYHGKDKVVVFDSDVVTALDSDERLRALPEGMRFDAVRTVAAAVDARSPGMEHHSRNVASLAVMLARDLQLEERSERLLEIAALLHDVGKVGVPDMILNKPAPLTDPERRVVRDHPTLGERIISSTGLVEVLPWVRHHHERWDGTGYPDGLAGEDIPLEARILALCDAYDAMTSVRPYRAARSKPAALQEIDLCLGTQFDPVAGDLFIGVVGRRSSV